MLADKKVSILFKEFCQNTTIQGLRFINGTKAKNNLIRLCWTILFLFMLWLFVLQCYISIGEYLQFNVATSVTYDMPLQLQNFPAITLCPRNVIKRSIASRAATVLTLASAIFNNGLSSVKFVS